MLALPLGWVSQGGKAAPGCKPPAMHQSCWPASGAAKSRCSNTPNRSQARAGPAPRAAGQWVLPSPPMQGGFLPSPPPHPHRLPPSQLWGCGAADSEGPSCWDQLLHSMLPSCSRRGCAQLPREDGLPGLLPGAFLSGFIAAFQSGSHADHSPEELREPQISRDDTPCKVGTQPPSRSRLGASTRDLPPGPSRLLRSDSHRRSIHTDLVQCGSRSWLCF